ncbi:efflux RND transporter permease subunit [Endozoicomonas sp. G2_1]|uniref:efflux RND transporter permease subunit n=1 Tax=Endozoicomonas sp. G2_1 TaxID=2821091 RepID=UPI001ADB8CA8|nr:efflux RND transporter permease subunit [Endozoicomonas sp. G2_1]MBO9489941.1 efflux RND transporter permease subunit [Endozoicomonas sp. G2_1]
MQLPRLAINNAQFTLTVVLLLVLVGLISYFTMPRSEDPQFDLPITMIEVIYPGASPLDIESLVINPLEDEFSEVENISSIESQIKNGGARIEIKFVYGTEPDLAYKDVKRAVAEVEPTLPDGVQELLTIKATPTSVAIVQIALWNEPTNYKTMEFYAKRLEKKLETIPAVRQADVWGYPTQIVAVDVNLALLKHYNLSVTDINRVLKGRAENITPGFVNASTRRFNVKTTGNYDKLTQISETVVKSGDNFTLRLEDVAQVSFSNLEPNYLAYYQDKAVVFITAQQRANTNIFELTAELEQMLSQFEQTIPADMQLEVLFKQADSVESRVNGFFVNLAQGLVLVGVMALVFLGIRESIVIITAIPLSFAIAIGFLDFTGFGLQQMSIVGLIIALGLLVDNAIVVTESIHREKSVQNSLGQAAASGTSKVGWAITSGTVTTMLAFLPMLLLGSNTGDFVRSMPVTVVLVLLASLLVALTLTPLLASKCFSASSHQVKTLQVYLNEFSGRYYRAWLVTMIKRRWLIVTAALALLLAMLSLFSEVGVSLFPKAEKPLIMVDVEMPPNTSLVNTNSVIQKVADRVRQHALVDEVALNIGNANPRIYYNQLPKRGVTHYGQLLVVLKEYQTDKVINLVQEFRSEFNQWHEAVITVNEFTQGPVTDKPIAIRLMGENLSALEQVANDVSKYMGSLTGIVNIDNPIGQANTELALVLDYDQAGVSNVDVNTYERTIKTLLSGEVIGLFNDDNGENYPVLVRKKYPDIESLELVNIRSRTGDNIPLNQIAKTQLQKGQAEFFHYQKLRMAKVAADVEQGYSVNELTAQVVNYLNDYSMPQGVSYSLGGEEKSRQENFAGLSQIMAVTAIGIFAVLVLQFKSFSQPLIIFSSIPFAIAGAIVGLYFAGISFSMMAFIGLISLFGIVVNNAIILIDTTNRHMREGQSLVEATLNASAIRFTPILLTTLTTIGGLLPLTALGGTLWQPLGIVIISGLCVSALSSFILVPILIELFTRTDKSSLDRKSQI